MKKLAIVVLVVLFGILCMVTLETTVKHTTQDKVTYERQMVVVSIDYQNDVVTLEDITGNLWDWYGVANWKIGDECVVTMNNHKTESIYDDEIVQLHEY